MSRRSLDLLLSTTGLLILWPLMLVIAIGVRLECNGPVLFRQIRVGKNGQPFAILKFRSMRPATEASQASIGDIARLTQCGKLLRRTKLDELPQLFNVIRGDMSLVGPRPELPHYVSLWSAVDRAVVLSVRPGITDFASLVYRREEHILASQNAPEDYYRQVILPHKLRWARFYVRRATASLNLWLIIQTAAVLGGLPARMSKLSLPEN